MEQQNVGVALDDDRGALAGDVRAGLVEPVDDLALAEQRAFLRVQVLRRATPGHLAGAEPAHPAAHVRQREHGAPPEPVAAAARRRQPGPRELLAPKPLALAPRRTSRSPFTGAYPTRYVWAVSRVIPRSSRYARACSASAASHRNRA